MPGVGVASSDEIVQGVAGEKLVLSPFYDRPEDHPRGGLRRGDRGGHRGSRTGRRYLPAHQLDFGDAEIVPNVDYQR